MAVNKTSLSAGEIIRYILANDEDVAARSKKIFPVVEDSAELPYVVYRRTQLEQVPAKHRQGADTVGIEVLCYTKGYTEGVELAEAVRQALDGRQCAHGGLTMRSCYLIDSEEAWQSDAYLQQLVFELKL